MPEWWTDWEPWLQAIVLLGAVLAALAAIWKYLGSKVYAHLRKAYRAVKAKVEQVVGWIEQINERVEQIPELRETTERTAEIVAYQLKPNGGQSIHDKVSRIDGEVKNLKAVQESVKAAKEEDHRELRGSITELGTGIERLWTSQRVLARLIKTEDDDNGDPVDDESE